MTRWELRRGDALRILAELPAASVDALITDPPYSSGGMVRGDRMSRTKTKYVGTNSGHQDSLEDFSGDNRDQRAYLAWCNLWLGECLRVVRPGGVAVVFTDWRQLPTTTDAVQVAGWVWRGIVPWCKPAARPQKGRFTNAAEYAVWASNGPMPAEGPCLPGYHELMPPREREHVAQKPVDLLRSLARICPEGGTILDPFAGSATTGVGALLEGRKFLGIELQPSLAEVAKRRLQEVEALACVHLFG